MTTPRLIELLAAVVLLVAGIYFYRRPRDKSDKGDNYGSQGAVILFVIAAIMAIHALGLLEYRPSAAESEILQGRGR